MSNGSVAPEALPALTALFAAAAVPNVGVGYGQWYDPPANFLAVGWDRTEQPSVTTVRSPGNAAMSQTRQVVSVPCLLSFSYDPAGTVLDVLEALYGAFDAYAQALTPPNALRDVDGVMSVSIVDDECTTFLTEAGALADLRFTVQIDALK